MIHYAEARLEGRVQEMFEPREERPRVEIMPCRHGTMVFFPHDAYIGGALFKYGEYVEGETRLLCSLLEPGDIVMEVGANIGCDTVPLARAVTNAGRVFAIEPQRIIHQMLCANLSVNGLWNVFADRLAMGRETGLASVPPVNYAMPGNFGGVSMGPSGEPVHMATLDSYGFGRLDLLKIDVEGMELDVLQGAADTIRRLRPTIYCENDRQEKSAALIAHLKSLDYDLFWHTPRMFSADNFRGDAQNIFGETVSLNMLCFPSEHKRTADGLIPVLTVSGGELA